MSPRARRSVDAAVFAALGDETRLALVAELARGKRRSISQLAQGSRLTRQAIAKHLRVLAAAGVVVEKREGRETLFQFAPEPLGEAASRLDRISRQWDDALERLKTLVEADAKK